MHQHLRFSAHHAILITLRYPFRSDYLALRVRRIYSTNVKFKLRINALKHISLLVVTIILF